MPDEPTADAPEISCPTVLKALADEKRFEVVKLLMKNPSHVKDLQTALCIDQSLLSHHLRLLRDAGIVQSKRDGKAVLYSLSPSVETRREGESLNLGCCKLSFSPDPSN